MAPNLFHWACSGRPREREGIGQALARAQGVKAVQNVPKNGKNGAKWANKMGSVNSQVRGSLVLWPLSPLSVFFSAGPSLTGWMQVRSFGRPQREDFLVLGTWGTRTMWMGADSLLGALSTIRCPREWKALWKTNLTCLYKSCLPACTICILHNE